MGDIRTRFTIEGEQQYKSAMADAANAVKVLNAEQKLAKAQFENTGNAEKYAAQQSDILKRKIDEQKKAVEAARQALKQLSDNSVPETSRQFQQWQMKLTNAQTALTQTENELGRLNGTMQQTSQGTQALVSNLNGISKKISLDQVIGGIDRITGGMEKAAKKAIELGNAIWDNIMDSARMADDIATQAMVLDMSTTQYQQYKGVFDTVAEMTVNDYMKAKRTIQKVLNDPSNDQTDALEALGFGTLVGKNGETQMAHIADNWEDAMWILAGELRNRVESGQLSEDMADIYGQALFGKSYANMRPFLDMGKEGFEAALKDVNTASEEAIENGAALNDAVIKLQGSFDALKEEVLGAIAPELTKVAEAIDSVLGSILEYLQTPAGQEMLKQMGESLGELFSGIQDISASDVVEGFKKVFDDLLAGVKWLANNKDSVIQAIEGAFGIFATLKVSNGVLSLIKLFNGAKGFFGGNSPATTGTAGNGGGGGWFGGNGSEMSIVSKTGALGLTGLTMLAPALLTKILSDMIPEENKLFSPERVKAATYSQEEVDRLREWVKLQNELVRLENEPGVDIFSDQRYAETLDKIAGMNVQQGDLWSRYWDYLVSNDKMPGKDLLPTEILDQMAGEGVPIKIDPVAPDDAAAVISEDIGSVPITVTIRDVEGAELLELLGGSVDGSHANGLPWVPYDGYLSVLHRGERVLTASQNRNYTYYNNTYFGGVNLNNGQDIDALVDSIDRHNRRRSSGFGE